MPVNYLSRPDLPGPLLKALSDPAYHRELEEHFVTLPRHIAGQFKHSFSVTTLKRSPREKALYDRHSSKLWLDPIGNYGAMHGRVVHEILQKYPDDGDIVEKRIGQIVWVDGIPIYIHGQADRIDAAKNLLQDWKETSTFAILKGARPAFAAQLNVLRWLWEGETGEGFQGLQNIFLLKDWRHKEVEKKKDKGYPQEPVVIMDQPFWDEGETQDYIKERVRAHLAVLHTPDDELPLCTPEERWKDDDEYGVVKLEADGTPQKVRKAVLLTEKEAKDWGTQWSKEQYNKAVAKAVAKNAALKKPKPDSEVKIPEAPKFIVQLKKGQSVFCSYCSISAFCSQRRAELAEFAASGQSDEEEDMP